MSYYRGDYYRGDYYRGHRGDPGFLSGLLNVGSFAAGFIPGVGGIVSKGLSAASSLFSAKPAASPAAAGMGALPMPKAPMGSLSKTITGAVLKHPVLTGAGAAGIAGVGAGLAAPGVLRAGKRVLGLGTKKQRRMRATNPKALRRALRRAYAFERIAMKTIKLVHPRKHGRFGGFKRAKKRVC